MNCEEHRVLGHRQSAAGTHTHTALLGYTQSSAGAHTQALCPAPLHGREWTMEQNGKKSRETKEGGQDVITGDFGRTVCALFAVTAIGHLLPDWSAHILAVQRISCIYAVRSCSAALRVCCNGTCREHWDWRKKVLLSFIVSWMHQELLNIHLPDNPDKWKRIWQNSACYCSHWLNTVANPNQFTQIKPNQGWSGVLIL